MSQTIYWIGPNVDLHLVWWRYIDDTIIFWQHGDKEPKKFLENLNSCHTTIKFTANYSREKKGNQVVTDLYKNFFLYKIFTLVLVRFFILKKSIFNSQALKLNRICWENLFLKENYLAIWSYGIGKRYTLTNWFGNKF